MKKNDLARRLAQKASLSPAAAVDQLDGVIHKILRTLRQGRTATLPGLGSFRLEQQSGVRFVPARREGGGGEGER